MARPRFTVAQLAKEADVDVDEILIALWDGDIDYVNAPASSLRSGDANRARRLVGIATRRELSSELYWKGLLKIDEPAFEALLAELNIQRTIGASRLSNKSISKLRSQARLRGVSSDPRINEPEPLKSSPAPTPFVWGEIVGRERDIRFLTTDEVRAIHVMLVEDFSEHSDPIIPSGERLGGLLESAVFRPYTGIGGVNKYPTPEMSTAALMHSLVHDHPFHNGNKRTALVAMLVCLDENGLTLTCYEDNLFKLVLRLAQHTFIPANQDHLADRETLALARWIKDNSRALEKGDRPIPFRRLRRILLRQECEIDLPHSSRIGISRLVRRKRGMLRRERTEVLITRMYYGDEGREVKKPVIGKIRRDLELDDLHGVDSASFYDDAPAAAGEFIINYRKTLQRLARL